MSQDGRIQHELNSLLANSKVRYRGGNALAKSTY